MAPLGWEAVGIKFFDDRAAVCSGTDRENLIAALNMAKKQALVLGQSNHAAVGLSAPAPDPAARATELVTAPFDDQVGTFADLQREGKVRHVGLSNVTLDQLESARRVVPIASVQNLYNLDDRTSEDLVDACATAGIGFIPWRPVADVASGSAVGLITAVTSVAERTGATPSQVALAWLLRRSPTMLPIPGTSSVAHLDENVAAALVALTDAEVEALTASS